MSELNAILVDLGQKMYCRRFNLYIRPHFYDFLNVFD